MKVHRRKEIYPATPPPVAAGRMQPASWTILFVMNDMIGVWMCEIVRAWKNEIGPRRQE